MSNDVPNLRGGHFETVKWFIALGGSIGAFVGALIWQAARYPDRAEFNGMVSSQFQTQLHVQHLGDSQDAMKAIEEAHYKELSGKIDILIQTYKPRR